MKRFILTSTALVLTIALVVVFSKPNDAIAAEVAVDTTITDSITERYNGSQGLVFINDQTGFVFFKDANNSLVMSSTTNGGATWNATKTIDSQLDVVYYSVWWDGWTPPGTTTDMIHIAIVDRGNDDIWYAQYNILTGTSSTPIVTKIYNASCSAGAGCNPAITKASNNVLYVAVADAQGRWIDQCSTNCTTASNWTGLSGGWYNTPSNDFVYLLPVPGNNNVLFVQWQDATVYSNVYSATSSSWINGSSTQATNTITTNIELDGTYDAQMGNIGFSQADGKIAFTIVDDANNFTSADHDVKFFLYDASTNAWTTKTNVMTNNSFQGAALSYDETNDTWYSVYARRTNNLVATSTNLYYRTSNDDGTTWSAESSAINSTPDNITSLLVNLMSPERLGVAWAYETAPNADTLYYSDIIDITVGGGGGTPVIREEEIYFMQ